MAKEYKRVLTRTCDYCEAVIEGESVKVVREKVALNGKDIGVEIKAFALGEDNPRFTDDICGKCLRAAATLGHYDHDREVLGQLAIEKKVDEGNAE